MSSTKDRINILLKDLGINQRELSKLTGVDTAIICRILSGKCEPTIQTLRKIAEATKTSPSWIIGYGSDDIIERI